jgi:hypothetical protein
MRNPGLIIPYIFLSEFKKIKRMSKNLSIPRKDVNFNITQNIIVTTALAVQTPYAIASPPSVSATTESGAVALTGPQWRREAALSNSRRF